ncbi:MAG: hypothetical protein H9893_09890 [Candidatus Niameybacter stercoravium]|nr:hypothetical protein [Candidatus Niameybacter stercoravium]
MGESIVILVICLICAVIFLGIGLYALKTKTPIHFWAGTVVKSEEITDIKAYNRANAIMWLVYGSLYIVAGILGFWSITLASILIGLSCLPGLIILILVNRRIEKKYGIKG